jgi:copper chaperone
MCSCNTRHGERGRSSARTAGGVDFRVDDMSCGHCANTITRAIEAAMPGASVDVDLTSRIVSVRGADDHARLQRIIAEAGYQTSPA